MPHDHAADCPGCAAPDLAFARHDHAHCAGDVLTRATDMAKAQGVRLTPVRRRVLEILLEGHRAMGAYDVLARLAEEGFGNQPPVAYRALEFLEEHGFAHRIRRLNAFAACLHPATDHAPVFLICRAEGAQGAACRWCRAVGGSLLEVVCGGGNVLEVVCRWCAVGDSLLQVVWCAVGTVGTAC